MPITLAIQEGPLLGAISRIARARSGDLDAQNIANGIWAFCTLASGGRPVVEKVYAAAFCEVHVFYAQSLANSS